MIKAENIFTIQMGKREAEILFTLICQRSNSTWNNVDISPDTDNVLGDLYEALEAAGCEEL
jgi:hypothetical protein